MRSLLAGSSGARVLAPARVGTCKGRRARWRQLYCLKATPPHIAATALASCGEAGRQGTRCGRSSSRLCAGGRRVWRFDKDWKALWCETPVRDRPSVCVRKHLRATLSPTLIPATVPARELAQVADVLDVGHLLLYSSDYPHDHGADALGNLLAVLSEADQEKVLRGSASEFCDIPVPARS